MLPSVRVLHDDVFRRLCRARDLIHDRCSEQLTLPQLARAAGISRYHFLRLFRDAFGSTPHQYLVRVRLERARKLLAADAASITDVCMDVGFSSLGSFSTLFAKRVGVPPSGYRRRVYWVRELPGGISRLYIPGCFLFGIGPGE
jgi:AraC-like DNA-binding protein